MSVQSEINRIKQNISDSLEAIAAYGVSVQSTDNSNTLASLIAKITETLTEFVKYTEQTLTEEQKLQARINIGAGTVNNIEIDDDGNIYSVTQ